MLWRMGDTAYVVDAVRSPIGRRNGSLSEIRADELAAQVLNGLIGRVDLEPGEIEDVQMGCVTQVGEQALNVGRGAVLVAGWPETVCATTVDRQCGSSLQAAFNAVRGDPSGPLPADIVWRTERALNDPDCRDASTPDRTNPPRSPRRLGKLASSRRVYSCCGVR